MSDPPGNSKLNEITEKVWSMVLGFRLEPMPFDVKRAESEPLVLGQVVISGAWRGAVTLGCSAGLARLAAAAMFGKLATEADQTEIRDALGELTNMVGGNFKTLLEGDCRLSMPDVKDAVCFQDVLPAEHHWFDCEGGVVLVNASSKEPLV